ncbi:chromate efflux transporter [Synechococcus sp. PCC 7336]|uniref:chromate efflux transporter n=1 Tax=Synechococcus sp. PCC 7336 TaxID=195250 RepID=UPI00034CDEA2|nr:chromate efflux transporter [Synechococcus sp. PCC 7336]
MAPQPSEPKTSTINPLGELARLFLKLGTIGFGGPQAHIAMMNDEAVVRRQWLSPEEFAEGLAVCEMLPGPASTQMGIYTGYVRAGQLGAMVAGISFIGPAFAIVVALSWGYFQFQELPQVDAIFLGVSPVVTAIVLAFCWKLGKKAIRTWMAMAIAIAVFFTTVLTSTNVLIQFVAGGLVGLWYFRPQAPTGNNPTSLKSWLVPPLPLLLGNLPTETLTLSSFWGLERIGEFFLPLTLFFLKTGSFIFGGGLVIIPLLEFEVVEQLHWLTPTEFINGVAIGQLSPGPVVLTAAFVGYKVAGAIGALVAAIAIFTPSFAFIMLAAPLLVRLRRNLWIRAFLQGVTPAVLGAIAAAAIPIARTALVRESTLLSAIAAGIGLVAIVASIRFKLPTWQLVPAGASLGLLASAVVP